MITFIILHNTEEEKFRIILPYMTGCIQMSTCLFFIVEKRRVITVSHTM